MAKNVEVVNENENEVVEEKRTFKEKAHHFFNDTKAGKALATTGKVAAGAVLALGAIAGIDVIKTKKAESDYYDLDTLTGDTTDSSQDQ